MEHTLRTPIDPSGNDLINEFDFYSFDSGAATKPYLTINHTIPAVQHVITSNPAGRSLTVDGAGCTSPCTFTWTPGTSHTIATTTPQAGGTGTSYAFASWSDGGALLHSITASSSSITYTANFTPQHSHVITSSPAGPHLTVDNAPQTCTSPCEFCWTPGLVHTITAASPQQLSGTNYYFSYWSGCTGLTNQSGPQQTVTAQSSWQTFTALFASNAVQALKNCISSSSSATCTLAAGEHYVTSKLNTVIDEKPTPLLPLPPGRARARSGAWPGVPAITC